MFCLGRGETDSLPKQDKSGGGAGIWEPMSSPGPSNAYIWLGVPETSESGALNTQINRMCPKAENTCPGMNHTSFPASPEEMPVLVSLPWNLKFSGRNFQVALWVEAFSHSTTKWPSLYTRKSLWNRQKKSSSLQGEPRHKWPGLREGKKNLAKTEAEWRDSGAIQEAWMSSGPGKGRKSKLFLKNWAGIYRLPGLQVASPSLSVLSRSVVSSSLRPHGLQPTRLPHPWDSPGKSTGVGCHFLLRDYSEPQKGQDKDPGLASAWPPALSNIKLPWCSLKRVLTRPSTHSLSWKGF